MQDRLVKELRLEGISTIEAANAFMPTYVADYNSDRGRLTTGSSTYANSANLMANEPARIATLLLRYHFLFVIVDDTPR
jgi:hypothetical protein